MRLFLVPALLLAGVAAPSVLLSAEPGSPPVNSITLPKPLTHIPCPVPGLTKGSVLLLTLPAEWKSKMMDKKLTLTTPNKAPYIQAWAVAGDAAAAEKGVAEAIVGQVKGFAVTKREELKKPAGAIRLIGSGTEADDGDPSNTEVVLIPGNDQVWILLAHGEGTGVADVRPELDKALEKAAIH